MDKKSRAQSRETVSVPIDYPMSLVFMDESGSRGSGGSFFVMSAVKVRRPGRLLRQIKALRDRQGFDREFKFSDLTAGRRTTYYELIDVLYESGTCFHATVVDRSVHDPFPGKETWEVQKEVAERLLIGCINKRELVTVSMDHMSTPEDVYLEDELRAEVNRRLGNGSVVSAAMYDSRSSDLLQVADLFAGVVGFSRRAEARQHGASRPSATSPKAMVAQRFGSTFGVPSFPDVRTDRINVQTLRPRTASRRPHLEVVSRATGATA